MKKWIQYSVLLCSLVLSLTACKTATADINKETADITEQEQTKQESVGKEGAFADEVQSAEQIITMSGDKPAVKNNYILPDSATRRYTEQELKALSPEQMKLARNEIYARHGRKFKEKDLQSYFQGESWYQGTVEPNAFDENQLSQIERDNISQLLRLEQQAKLQTIVSKYQDRKLYLSTGKSPRVIDHGSYYEVTKCQILEETRYPLSLMDGKAIGATLQIDGNMYQITDILSWYSGEGEYIGLKDMLEPDSGEDYCLARNYSNSYYLMLDDDDASMDILYSGSLYFSKDCVVTLVYAPGENVSVSDLFTKDYKEVGAEFGLTSDGLSLWGDFTIDSSGLIISYNEKFRS